MSALNLGDDATPEEAKEALNSYAAALRQEFEDSNKRDPENVEQYTKSFFRDNVPMAAAQVVWLAGNADSESVRLNAAKAIINSAFDEANKEGDPIKELLKSLTKVKRKPAPINGASNTTS